MHFVPLILTYQRMYGGNLAEIVLDGADSGTNPDAFHACYSDDGLDRMIQTARSMANSDPHDDKLPPARFIVAAIFDDHGWPDEVAAALDGSITITEQT